MATLQDKVVCRTYNKDQEFKTHKDAIKFFKECVMGSEGSEQSRYVTVLMQLMDGKTFCSDEEST